MDETIKELTIHSSFTLMALFLGQIYEEEKIINVLVNLQTF